jgi:hypothetical protein
MSGAGSLMLNPQRCHSPPLLLTPLEALAHDKPIVSGGVPLRAGFLLLILLGLRTTRMTAVEAGQLFLTQALLCTVSWQVLLVATRCAMLRKY